MVRGYEPPRVRLEIRKIGDRWSYCKPVYGANNKIKPHWVYVKGKPEEHPEGNFYIHKLDHGRQVWKKIGPNPADAVRAAQYEEQFLHAIAMGLPIKNEETPDLTYGPQMWKFLEDYKLSQSDESHVLMMQTLQEFSEHCKKVNLTDITREDLLRYKKWLVNRNRSFRTAGNKMLRVNQFLRAALGVDAGKGLVTVKDTRFVEREPPGLHGR